MPLFLELVFLTRILSHLFVTCFPLETLYRLSNVLVCSIASWHKNGEMGIGGEFRCRLIHLQMLCEWDAEDQ